MSVQEILLISLSCTGQTSLPYIVTLVMKAAYKFPFILCKNTLDVRRVKSSLNFFQPDLMWDVVLASAPPPAQQPYYQHSLAQLIFLHHL